MNYFLNFKYVWLFLLFSLIVNNNSVLAQKGEKKENPPKEEKTKPAPKEEKVKPAKNGNSQAAIEVQVHGLTRDEKNAMARCPLHNKPMSLSNNYRADASDYEPGDHYPFAYQLNYRRYCLRCTKVMSKEAHVEDTGANKGTDHKAVAERCQLHNTELKTNSDYDKASFEKNPASDMPHAKQYKLKSYCNICTKVYNIQHK